MKEKERTYHGTTSILYVAQKEIKSRILFLVKKQKTIVMSFGWKNPAKRRPLAAIGTGTTSSQSLQLARMDSTSAKLPKTRRKIELSESQKDQIRQAFDVFDHEGIGSTSYRCV